MKKLNLELDLTEDEYNRLDFLSRRLGVNMTEALKALIPNIPVFSQQNVKTILGESESLEIRKGFDINRFRELIESLEKEKVASTLAGELRHQILETGDCRTFLTGITERRLRRWANPARIDERTKIASPIAREICVVLFGFNPGRGEQ
jgi:hypothetical protein